MTAPDKIRAVLLELNAPPCALAFSTSPRGKEHDFRVTIAGKTLHGCTTRAIIRALRRHISSPQQPKLQPHDPNPLLQQSAQR